MRVRPTTMKAAKEETEEVEPKSGARPEMGLKEEARMLLMHSDDETWPDQKRTNGKKKKTNRGGSEDFVVFQMLLFQNHPLKEMCFQ